MYQAVEIIVPLGAFAMVFGIVYIVITATHREKMAMIEAGMNPKESNSKNHSKIRNGLLFIMVPLGVIIGNLLSTKVDMLGNGEMGLIFAFLFGGIGLTAAYFLEKKLENNSDKDL